MILAGCSAASVEEPAAGDVDRRPEASASTVAPADEKPATTTTGPKVVPAERDLSPYAGLGTWVDAFDFAPAFSGGGPAPVTPDDVDRMADVGVTTLYLQASKDDTRSPGLLVDDRLVADFLLRSHAKGIKVVAWFLPKLADVEADFNRLKHLVEYEVDGHRFDGIAVDIEEVESVPDVHERNRRLVDLSARLDEVAGDAPLGAIVFPPVATDVLNPNLWPEFPFRELAASYDVWMPMGYWTYRSLESGYRDASTYTAENVRRLRTNVGDPKLAVHPIGGIGDLATVPDYQGFVNGARSEGAMGWSIYDWNTMQGDPWPALQFNP